MYFYRHKIIAVELVKELESKKAILSKYKNKLTKNIQVWYLTLNVLLVKV